MDLTLTVRIPIPYDVEVGEVLRALAEVVDSTDRTIVPVRVDRHDLVADVEVV